MARNMKIVLPNYKGQNIKFINIFNEFKKSNVAVTSMPYDSDDEEKQSILALLNYIAVSEPLEISDKQGLGVLSLGDGNRGLNVFKQEIDNEGNALTPLEIVAENLSSYKFRDYKVSNHRNYKYFVYLSQNDSDNVIYKTSFTVKTNWQDWSITELHPTDETMKSFTANPEDVWLFNLNVDTGEQTQNVSVNEVQTLGMYPRISQGNSNYITGSVSCLLGAEVISVGEALKRGLSLADIGYSEIRKYSNAITSNQRVDMLKAWRKMVSSKNPKLLKDREGQAFLVSLSNATNKPMDAAKIQPNTISFNWTQIGTLDGVTIANTYD